MIERAIELEPQAPPGFYVALSDCRYLTGDYQGSLDALDQVLDGAYYLRLYRLPAWRTLGLPLAAIVYGAMTIASAIAHWRGKGGAWKGRTY